jgi:hypothetical protein
MTNGTLKTIHDMLGDVTHVSWFNNSNYNYTSWVVGLTTNNQTKFEEMDVVYVRVPRTAVLLWQNIYQTGNVSQKAYNLTAGWNQVSLMNITLNFTEAYKLNGSSWVTTSNWTNTSDVKGLSWYNASSGQYMSSLYSLSINKIITIQRGMGMWINVNQTTMFYTKRL